VHDRGNGCPTMSVRVGLVGTGHWARTVHAESLSSYGAVDFVGIWGRNSVEREDLARKFATISFESYEDLLAGVDVVDFAIAPEAQRGFAVRAALSGKSLLLEKPLALTVADASCLVRAVSDAGVRAVVFLTRLFDPVRSRWLAEQFDQGWTSARAVHCSSALVGGSPYAACAWRQAGGALWDIGPHVLSQLVPVLGPIDSVRVTSYEKRGITELSFWHEGGGESTARMTLHGDPVDGQDWIEFSDGRESRRSPMVPMDFVHSHTLAMRALIEGGEPGDPHLVGLPYGVGASLESIRVLSVVESVMAGGYRSDERVAIGGMS